MQPGKHRRSAAPSRTDVALDRAARALLSYQQPDGRFNGDIDQGTAPTAQTLVVECFLQAIDPSDAAEMARWILGRMQEDGGFLAYPHATFSTMTETCCAYAALAAAGVPEDDPRRRRVKAWIDARGGFTAADPISLCFLVMAGVLPPERIPRARIEHVLLPGIERYVFRTFALYYALVLAFILPGLLYGLRRGSSTGRLADAATGRLIDHLLRYQNPEGNWAGSQWVTALALACLKTLGVAPEHDAMVRGLASLRRLRRRRSNGLEVLSLTADVWNTAMALRVLGRAGVSEVRWVKPSLDFLLSVQSSVAAPSEIIRNGPGAPRAGAWDFEGNNPLGADTDTTSMVLLALAEHDRYEGVPQALERGVFWLRSMQHEEGGFAAFSRPNRIAPPVPLFREMPAAPKGAVALARFFVKPPYEFADIPTADLTGRVLCALARVDGSRNRVAIAKAAQFLLRQQQGNRWWGRWTTNYIAGTAFALQGLAAAGETTGSEPIRRATEWILSRQNKDGGFGESNDTYAHPERAGEGPSNAYLTGLVLHALCATGQWQSAEASSAAAYLCETQRTDGLWEDLQAVQSMAPPELFYMNFVNFQTAPIEALAIYHCLQSGDECPLLVPR